MHIDRDYTNLIKYFNEANTQIKILEQEHQQLSEPAISQLRDSAYHMIKALETNDTEIYSTQMQKAEGHALRAKYDTYEARMTFYLKNIKTFTERFSSRVETNEVITNYVNLLKEVETIKVRLKQNVELEVTSRHDYYANIENEINQLKEIQLTLKISIPTLVTKINYNNNIRREEFRKRREESKKYVNNLIIAISTLVVTIVGVYIGTLN